MAYYPSADALLADVRLRLEGLGSKSVALVVEGYDDKRLFYHRITSEAEVVPSGGKRLLRASLRTLSDADKGRILFLTDCDYDILNGTLRGGPDVVITNACDVEADLIGLDLLERVVVEVIPSVVRTRDAAIKVAADVRQCAEAMARTLGRIRIAAQSFGVDLKLDELNYARYWDENAKCPLTDKLYVEMLRRLISGGMSITKDQWAALIARTPDNPNICNGKDLIGAVRMILCAYYKMDHKITVDMMTSMIRLALDEAHFESWTVVRRMHQWEKRNSCSLLASAA